MLGWSFGWLVETRIVGGAHLGVGQFVILLPLHPPVLKPDLDLPLRQAECVRDLNASPPGQVAVKMELLLQLQDLLSCIGSPRSFWLTSIVAGAD